MLPPFQGDRFGRWTVLKDRQYRDIAVLCRCDCGTEKIILVGNLRAGCSKSCGCLKREQAGTGHYRHGIGYEDYRYRLWQSIKGKCLRPSQMDYRHYGGRGIGVYAPWVDDFIGFAAYLDTELGPRPEGYTLDRIDNDGNYEPGNIRWASRAAQSMNRRVTKVRVA